MNTAKGYAIEFRKKLIEISKNKTWNQAKNEWIDAEIMFKIDNTDDDHNIEYFTKKYPNVDFTPCQCICGHYIMEHCVIKNKLTGIQIAIGNCCIAKFGTKYHNEISKNYKNISSALRNLKHKILDERTIYILPEYVNSFLLKNKYITNEEYQLLENVDTKVKKYNKQIKSDVSYENFIKFLEISFKIIKGYFHKEIKNKQINDAMFDIIMYLVNNHQYKEKYYDQNVEKSPEDENTKYQLVHKINGNDTNIKCSCHHV